jgi:hypothetical protein
VTKQPNHKEFTEVQQQKKLFSNFFLSFREGKGLDCLQREDRIERLERREQNKQKVKNGGCVWI